MRVFEARRVQKLGASSLIVTIPKNWAKSLGIEPGEIVYLVKEGDTIRIMPSARTRKEKETPVLRIKSEEDLILARQAVNCIYVSGLDKATIKSTKKINSLALEVKRQALDLMGVEVYEEDDKTLQIMIFIDLRKTEIGGILRQLANSSLKTINTIEGILSGTTSPERAKEELTILKKEFQRYQHAILRYLATERTHESSHLVYIVATASSYFGFVTDILLSYINLLLQTKIVKGNMLGEQTKNILENLKKIIPQLANLIINPDTQTLTRILENLRNLETDTREIVAHAKLSKPESILLSQILVAERIIKRIIYVIACKLVLSAMGNVDLS